MKTHIEATIETTKQQVREFLGTSGKSRHWLAKKAGVSEVALRDVEEDSWNPLSETLVKLERAIFKIVSENE